MIRSAVAPLRLGALGLAAILLLGGCSGSTGEPNAEAAENSPSSPSSSESTSPMESAAPSATPTPTAAYKPATAESPAENVPLPVMPDVAKEQSKEGLETFGEHWFDLVNYGYETGETSPVRAISAPDCERCESFYADVNEGYVNDDWIQGGHLRVISRGTQFIQTPEGRFQLILSIRQDASFNRGPNGKIYHEAAADEESSAFIMEATYVSDHWVVNLVENM
ncbi:DUF6318 family protein [Arthrobacter gengyunqii]|uniref:DUF6318 family protein n=1 Tax=Arthrobacter gengyunqii TaxID=2886940 RepID=A0A9X1M3I5_9MICC|nr:DUF6318 family protein [Arthrobacter gengyunqii]MCC3269947.1 DUF6318 family protein [Arthrobacter gengyunqii]UOY95126.1 DUF6318 family protein [Arthrobacter gengyunqii]